MNDIMNDIMTFFDEKWPRNGHNQAIMNDMNDIVNNKKGHNIVNDILVQRDFCQVYNKSWVKK